jgi:gingipain R
MYDGDKNELDLAGDPTPDMIATSMNNGLSIVNYTGHGGINGVSTGLFQTSELYRIHNYNKIWPVWFTVGCRPGYFVAYDCFAEEIMRKRDTLNRPIGALAIVASTVDQYWDPPMQAQDESNSILAGMYPDNLKYTYGAIFTNGLYSMIENYDDTNSTDGSDMADAWQYFGDPSVQLFTSYQDSISVQNPCILSPSAGSVSFQCTIADADIAIASNGSLIDHKKSNGSLVTLTIPNGIISIGDTVWITATKYNHRPFQSYMIVSNDFSACNITEFSISPNPLFNGTTVIKSPEPIQDIRVVDLNGNTQLDIISLGTNIYTLDISRLPIGLYFVQVITSSGDRKIKKLIKR